jgi:4-amino-4-deoxy-L-arabinose transferase-like glycosyltransferase
MLVFLGLGVVWRVARYAAGPPVWGDEAFLAVSLLTRDFAGLLRPLEYFQLSPVGFLWAELAVFRALGGSEWSLRLIPFLSGLISLVWFARFASKVVDRRSALFALGIFAASFYPVRHATEIKPYATDLMIAMMTLSLAWSLWLDRDSLRKWVWLTLLIAVGVWFSYPLVFVATGMGSVLAFGVIRRPSRHAVAGLLAFGLIAGTSFLASYLLVASPQSKAAPFYSELKTWEGAFPPLRQPWLLPYWLLDVHTGNMLAYPNGGKNFASLGPAFLVFVGAWTLRRSRPAFLAMLLSPLVPTLLAACLHRYPYGTSARTTLYMAPSFCLLAGIGLVSLIRKLREPNRPRAYRITTLTLVGMIALATVVNVGWAYKNYEDTLNRLSVERLADLARPGDLWVVYDGVETLPVSKGLMLEHWLQQMAEVQYNVLAKAPVPVVWMPSNASVPSSTTGRTWLIVHRSGCRAFDEGRLVQLKKVLGDCLGAPQSRVDRLTRGETIESFEYSAPGPASTPR